MKNFKLILILLGFTLLATSCKKELAPNSKSYTTSSKFIVDVNSNRRSAFSPREIEELYMNHEMYDSFGTSIVTVGSTWGFRTANQKPNFIISSFCKISAVATNNLKVSIGSQEFNANSDVIALTEPSTNWINYANLFGKYNNITTTLNNGLIQFDTSLYFPKVSFTTTDYEYTDTGYVFTLGTEPLKINWESDKENPIDLIMLKLQLVDLSNQEQTNEVTIITDDDGSYAVDQNVLQSNFGVNQKINVHFARLNYVKKQLTVGSSNYNAFALIYNQNNMSVYLKSPQ